jgi:hypothetical protein
MNSQEDRLHLAGEVMAFALELIGDGSTDFSESASVKRET